MACWRSNTRALKGLVVMVASLGFACGGDSGSPTAPTTSPAPTPTTTSFQGVLAGVGEIGTLELTVQAAVSSLDTARAPQVASASSGSVRLAGSGGPVSLTGTYEDSTREVTMSGGGFTFIGVITGDGMELAGPYTGPGGASGGFVTLNTAGGTVTGYCGTFTGAGGGRLAMSISAGGIVSGGWINTANGASGNIRGRRSGSSLTLTSDPDIHIEGTQSGNALSGTWSDANEGGTWQVSVAGCQQEAAAPAP